MGLIAAYRPEWVRCSSQLDTDKFGIDGYEFDPGKGLWARRAIVEPSLHPDLSLLLSTSGSTGSPESVRLSPAGISKPNAASIREITADHAEMIAPVRIFRSTTPTGCRF